MTDEEQVAIERGIAGVRNQLLNIRASGILDLSSMTPDYTDAIEKLTEVVETLYEIMKDGN